MDTIIPASCEEYIVKGVTHLGYYVEIIMMMMSSSFNASFKMRINSTGISFYENNSDMMINIDIDGFDEFYADADVVGNEYVIESTKKNYNLSNNKKKDSASIFIKRSEPESLLLQIRDSGSVVSTNIVYALKSYEFDCTQEVYTAPQLRYVNPTVIIDTGEMTKTIKVVTKASEGHVVIESQPKAVRFLSQVSTLKEDGTAVPNTVTEMVIGEWDNSAYGECNSINVNKNALKSVMKFYNLGKKLRIYAKNSESYSVSLPISQGLGYGTIVFCPAASA